MSNIHVINKLNNLYGNLYGYKTIFNENIYILLGLTILKQSPGFQFNLLNFYLHNYLFRFRPASDHVQIITMEGRP